MTLTKARPAATRSEPLVRLAIGILFFLGLTALGGGAAMTFGLGGDEVVLPSEWLESIPLIDSWIVPGIVLAVGFGLGSFLVGYGVLTRHTWRLARPVQRATAHHWAWLGTLCIGAGHVLWIGLQFVFLPGVSWLMIVYGIVGLTLLLLPLTESMRSYLRTS